MKRFRRILLRVVAALVVMIGLLWAYAWHEVHGPAVDPAVPGTIRVACVGDSITFGDWFRKSARYPVQLQALLGAGYSVRNFGAPGFTAQKAGDHPYWEHRYFGLGTAFDPNVVVLMLGSNDSKRDNWASMARFEADYLALIQHYQALPGKPRIILMTPPAMFLNGRKEMPFGMNPAVVEEISEKVKEIGASLRLSVIDVHAITAPHGEYFTRDGIHPDGDGEGLISRAVYEAIAAAPAGSQ
jgi:acyl-CoA thioesterase I